MSEESKMGLFGSKDEKTVANQATISSEVAKQSSPDTYAPYSIDSETETYDTEALSIMDINDIIGVQSGRAVESTLESEIAALSEIITNSGTDRGDDALPPTGESYESKFNDDLMKELDCLSPSENPAPSDAKDSIVEELPEAKTIETSSECKTDDAPVPETITAAVDEPKSPRVKPSFTAKDTANEPTAAPVMPKTNSEIPSVRSSEEHPMDVVKKESETKLIDAPSFDDNDAVAEKVEIDKASLPENKKNETSENQSPVESTVVSATDRSVETATAKDTDLPSKPTEAWELSTNTETPDASDKLENDREEARSKSEEVSANIETANETVDDVRMSTGCTFSSLQLIGEAYISEDSQETDSEESRATESKSSLPGTTQECRENNVENVSESSDQLLLEPAKDAWNEKTDPKILEAELVKPNEQCDESRTDKIEIASSPKDDSQPNQTETTEHTSVRMIHEAEQTVSIQRTKQLVTPEIKSKESEISSETDITDNRVAVRESNQPDLLESETSAVKTDVESDVVPSASSPDSNQIEITTSKEQRAAEEPAASSASESRDAEMDSEAISLVSDSSTEPIRSDMRSTIQEHSKATDLIAAADDANDTLIPPISTKPEIKSGEESSKPVVKIEDVVEESTSLQPELETSSKDSEEFDDLKLETMEEGKSTTEPLTLTDNSTDIVEETEKSEDIVASTVKVEENDGFVGSISDENDQDAGIVEKVGRIDDNAVVRDDSDGKNIIIESRSCDKSDESGKTPAKEAATSHRESAEESEEGERECEESITSKKGYPEDVQSNSEIVEREKLDCDEMKSKAIESQLTDVESELKTECESRDAKDLIDMIKDSSSSIVPEGRTESLVVESREDTDTITAKEDSTSLKSIDDTEQSVRRRVIDDRLSEEGEKVPSQTKDEDANASEIPKIEEASRMCIDESVGSSNFETVAGNNYNVTDNSTLDEERIDLPITSEARDTLELSEERDANIDNETRTSNLAMKSVDGLTEERNDISTNVDRKVEEARDENLEAITLLPERDSLSGESKIVENDSDSNAEAIPSADVLSLLQEIPGSEIVESLEGVETSDNLDETSDIYRSTIVTEGSEPKYSNSVVATREDSDSESNNLKLLRTVEETFTPESSEEMRAVDSILIEELSSSILKENVDNLACLDNLEILPETRGSPMTVNPEELSVIEEQIGTINPELISENVNEIPFEETNETIVSRTESYVSDVISASSASISDAQRSESSKGTEPTIEAETINSQEIEAVELDLPLKEEEEKLIEEAVLDVKIDLTDKGLFDVEESTDLSVPPLENAESSQQSSEISELECAVKFLQESEEHCIDSPLLSPKITEDVRETSSSSPRKSCLFLPETEVSGLSSELEEVAPDSIAISEAEIISEAAKLEDERRLTMAAEMSKISPSVTESTRAKESTVDVDSGILKNLLAVTESPYRPVTSSVVIEPELDNQEMKKLSESIIRRSDRIPKTSILEERLKEPPKIEIPVPEISPRIGEGPSTPKTSLLIQRDSRSDGKSVYQKILDSPKSDKIEGKISDTPRKDSDKYEFENVGSPRIILKIAKSAIHDCGEPRSPKSPKIKSAANSPNPEDSPGQKLGKIKLKLSKGGHPSIISNENFEEIVQRHGEGSAVSLSPIGMKIKLSKTGDPSIVQPEKQDFSEDNKEMKHKYGEASPKRTDSPLGMKIKLSKTGDPSIVHQDARQDTTSKRNKEKAPPDAVQESSRRTESPIGERPKRIDSPLGMKFKLSKSGDATIIPPETSDDSKESSSKAKEKLGEMGDKLIPKQTDSHLGMKIKLSKSGGASIIYSDKCENSEESKDSSESMAEIKRVESPIGMKIKLSKSGDASIVLPDSHDESSKHKEKSENQEVQKRTDSPLGMRIKVTKTGEASVVSEDLDTEGGPEVSREVPKRNDSPFGMKIKLSKRGDASIIHSEKPEMSEDPKTGTGCGSQESSKSESTLGMKFKLSKSGDASIISPESKGDYSKRVDRLQSSQDDSRRNESSPLGMKIKLSKSGGCASIIEPDKKDNKSSNVQPEVSMKRKEAEFPIEMKIKLSKTGHATIIASDKQEIGHAEMQQRSKDSPDAMYKREVVHDDQDSQLKIFKSGHSTTIIQNSRSEVTIEPVKSRHHPESSMGGSSLAQDKVVISPIDSLKSKMESKLAHMLPEVTIQPVKNNEQKQIMFDKKSRSISRQQMSVINQEISITQVTPTKKPDITISEKLKEILEKNSSNSPGNSDCEIIEHRPELIIVNENSNSSQDIMIIKEVTTTAQEIKVPRKRGRPRRSALPVGPTLHPHLVPRDPLALDDLSSMSGVAGTANERRESDRPKRTCRSQKSYAPPKRGRGRGRGKRKMDRVDCAMSKVARFDDQECFIEDPNATIGDPMQSTQPSALFTALQHGAVDRKKRSAEAPLLHLSPESSKKMRVKPHPSTGQQFVPNFPEMEVINSSELVQSTANPAELSSMQLSNILQLSTSEIPQEGNAKLSNESDRSEIREDKIIISEVTTNEPQNWLTPSLKQSETSGKNDAMSIVQVMDEETRMSAESNSRSQTPARNVSVPAIETVINEESQGSVLSTATTESEKVKVKTRRMEIQFDPDEGPFTVDKLAEYEWPLDKKGDTFMIQEQISQYLSVKSFKRKYPDLKRRMVEMEERNYLRENGLVSESMCDMGLTAICSSEVLDVMCSDFPDQYEEYRKHMREKQAKEHSKKQKELTAAANAERNRIDLAEMAVQSALSWNVNFNKARKDARKYSLDLQTFTIHVPKKQQKVEVERKTSDYPVALIPGQYTDYYREYTPAELRYYPLNTVLYGPMRPNERKFDSQSEGSQSDSDSDSSSDDSSSSSSEGTQDTEESQSTVDEADLEIVSHKEENKNLKCKMCLKHLNKHGKTEVLIQCGTCNGNVHPSCIDLTLDMVPHIQAYAWQCTDCKNCVLCHDPADEDKMLFCDMCDRGYHIYCVGLRRVPQGRWHCRECAMCASCGLRQPGGANSDRNSVAQWQHEYKKGERNTRVYVSTLCVPCSKLWRKGRYCPYCSRCHSAQRLDLEANLVHCGVCDKYLHLGCAETKNGPIDRTNYICEFCSTPSQQSSKSSISKMIKI